MQRLGKILAAGALSAVMMGATIGFAADLANYPAPFVEDGTVSALVVVGKGAATEDVVGAIDLAARLGGAPSITGTCPACPGIGAQETIVGEGKAISTTNTKIYLDDSLGKSGLRTTMTSDDLPTLLAKGTFQDTDASTTHNYQQFIYLTPSDTTSANYRLQFERPGSASGQDPTYSFGRFPTSPSNADYFYSTYVSFDRAINGSTAAGEKITLFGKEYTIHTDTTDSFAGSTSDKLVLAGSSATKVLSGGETATVVIGGKSYDITFVGASSATTAVVRVGSDQRSITAGSSVRVGGLDVYVDDVFLLSTTDQTQNSAKLLLGAEKVILQHGSKVKLGDTEDPVDGTYVSLVTSGNKLSAFRVYVGGRSSTEDYLALGSSYSDPIWKSFSIRFNSITPDLTDTTRNILTIAPSGDNILQATITDDKGQTATINWAYKGTSSGQVFSLADNSGNAFKVVEGETIARDQYIILDAGDFTHLFQVSNVNLDGSTSASIDLRDVFSGATTRITTGADNEETAYIDGQAYHFDNVSSTTFKVTWGSGSDINNVGTYTTVFPVLKGKNGEKYAFTKPNATVTLVNNGKIQLPTGSLLVTKNNDDTWNFTATTNEDGTTSVMTSAITSFNSTNGTKANFTLGRTATGATYYYIEGTGATTMYITLGGSDSVPYSQPAILLVEEKDDAGNVYSVAVGASTQATGTGNYLAVADTPDFTADEDSSALGTNANIYNYVDLYGVYAVKDSSTQATVKIYYPDEQAIANVYVLAEGASVTTTGATTGTPGSTYREAVPITTSIAKLDSEVTDADRATKNFILVGGPCANSLVAELAAAGKFTYENAPLTCSAWDARTAAGETFGLIELIDNAFATGKVALVVAGSRATQTRWATGIMQDYGAYRLSGTAVKVTSPTTVVTI